MGRNSHKKHKKHKKKEKKHKKERKHSSSSESSEEEWVEEVPASSTKPPELVTGDKGNDWLDESDDLFATITRSELKQRNQPKDTEKPKSSIETLGQSDRELNPYWKDGGTGLPSSCSETAAAVGTVGDMGLDWLKRALSRARQRAEEEKKPLEEIVAPTWGSLEKLLDLIKEAEDKARQKQSDSRQRSKYSSNFHDSRDSRENVKKVCGPRNRWQETSDSRKKATDSRERWRESRDSIEREGDLKYRFKEKRDFSDKRADSRNSRERESRGRRDGRRNSSVSNSDSSDSSGSRECHDKASSSRGTSGSREKGITGSNRRSRSNSREKVRKDFGQSRDSGSRFQKPKDGSPSRDYLSGAASHPRKPNFIRPSEDGSQSRRNLHSSKVSNVSRQENFAGFRTSNEESAERKRGWRKAVSPSSPSRVMDTEISPTRSESPPESKSLPEQSVKSPSRSRSPDEKPEILTQEEMNKLGAQIIKAEILGNDELAKTLQKRLSKAQAWLYGKKKSQPKEQEVVLMRTDSKGFTHPVNASSSSRPSKAKKTKVETHQDGKRVRFFEDDDKYSLSDLYQQEKFISASDGNEMYSRLASKGVGKEGSSRDMDDMFEETARVDKGDEWKEFRRKQQAVRENEKRERVLDACQRCIDNNTNLRHLVISMMDKVYLCVPPYGSIVEGHCLIIPNQHIASATLLDEDVWEEIMDLRKLLVKMFAEDDDDIIFFENVRNLNKLPHMVIHCVPVPRETGDVAPIYFKKALLECETEWSNNKKVIDLKGRDVRKAVPKGLPYFSVDFGLQTGFAHVIEDEQLFPRNFAEEIIGGMMDLDHSLWRKQKKDTPEAVQKKAQALLKKFKAFAAKEIK